MSAKRIITTAIDREIESEFRELAMKIFRKKGYYSRALEEAMLEWIKKRKSKDIVLRALSFLETGLKGKKWKFKREEAHER